MATEHSKTENRRQHQENKANHLIPKDVDRTHDTGQDMGHEAFYQRNIG